MFVGSLGNVYEENVYWEKFTRKLGNLFARWTREGDFGQRLRGMYLALPCPPFLFILLFL